MDLQGILTNEKTGPSLKLAHNTVREPSSHFMDMLKSHLNEIKKIDNPRSGRPEYNSNEIRDDRKQARQKPDEQKQENVTRDNRTEENAKTEKNESAPEDLKETDKKPAEETMAEIKTEEPKEDTKGKVEAKSESDDLDADLKNLIKEKFQNIEKDIQDLDRESMDGGEAEIDMEKFFEGFNQLIDILNKGDLKPELKKEIDLVQKMLEDLIRQKGGKDELARLIKLVEKLEDLFAKKAAEMKNYDPADLKARSLLKSLKQRIAKAVHNKIVASGDKEHEHQQNMVTGQNKPSPDKIETLLSQIRPEGGENQKGDQGHGSQSNQGMGMQFGKQSTAARSQSAQAMTGRSAAFREQLDSIIQNARVVVKDGRNGTMTLKLYPRELGTVNVNLGLEQGVINGRFMVDNQDARNLLMENLSHIRDQLMEAGISVGEFQVDVNDPRGQLSSEESEIPVYAVPGDAGEVHAEYEYNEQPVHTGAINVII